MLRDEVNVEALVPVRLEPGDLLRACPGAVVAKNTLSLVDDNDRAVRQVEPLFRRVELNPLGLEPIGLQIGNAVVIDRPGRQLRVIRVLVQTNTGIFRVGLMLKVDFTNGV
ncbi:hypothetical protein D3C78_1642820 [compost metagenome]